MWGCIRHLPPRISISLILRKTHKLNRKTSNLNDWPKWLIATGSDDEHRKLLEEIEHEEKSKTNTNGKFGAVGFDYDNGNNEQQQQQGNNEDKQTENEENDKPYQVPANLKSLPKNIKLPQYQVKRRN